MKKVLVLAGPTAVGKTEYAIEIAKELNCEIVNCDSMQLYKYMDIGSAKPTKEELSQVKHYLVDQIDPREKFSVAEYQKLAKAAIEEIFEKGKIPLITGGTGLYLNSLIYDMDFGNTSYDEKVRQKYEDLGKEKGGEYLHALLREKQPEGAERIHPNNTKRLIRALEAVELNGNGLNDIKSMDKYTKDYEPILSCLIRDRKQLYDRINLRVDLLVKNGLLEEVKGLMDMGFTSDDIAMKGIGYKEIIDYYDGQYDLDTAIDLVKRNTRRYAKRQITWFKRYKDMKWFDLNVYTIEDIVKWFREKL